jgi:mRNA-degrading endonuclease YafQ of YafQ-DinJ toxin-antitoxin module
MRGVEGIWEARVSISYRLTFQIIEDTVFLRRIGTHEILRKETG